MRSATTAAHHAHRQAAQGLGLVDLGLAVQEEVVEAVLAGSVPEAVGVDLLQAEAAAGSQALVRLHVEVR